MVGWSNDSLQGIFMDGGVFVFAIYKWVTKSLRHSFNFLNYSIVRQILGHVF